MNILKLTIILILCTSLIACHRSLNETIKSIDPFSSINFDKAIAYDFPGDTDILLLDSNGLITKKVTKQVRLNQIQIEKIKAILMDSTTFGDIAPKDFYPHFGLAFYNQDTIIQHLEISLPCNSLSATFDIPEFSTRTNYTNGFTKKGRLRILSFCKELGFSQYLDSTKTRWAQ